MIAINRSSTILKADPKRVVLLYNNLGMGTYMTKNRSAGLVLRILKLTEAEEEELYDELQKQFDHRHKNMNTVFINHYNKVKDYIPFEIEVSEQQKMILGAHFTKEYSIQSAALFNPSIVPHPDQKNLEDGEKRLIVSLRSVGEGHISSIEFRNGVVSSAGEVTLDPTTPFATRSEKISSTVYNKFLIKKRTAIVSDLDSKIFDALPNDFTQQKYTAMVHRGDFEKFDDFSQQFLSEYIDTNYNVVADENTPLSERVIFPNARGESMGMEDVRFVEFTHDNGRKEYIGTYTAYNGHKITPQLIMTEDFVHFRIRTMFGKAVSDKGFALFPEKINGKYMMTARQGGEDLTLMESDDLYNWDEYQIIMSPEFSWGLVQQGNCGSPLKTIKGWLLITHAVGPLRKYVISAILLDLAEPHKIVGKLTMPLISPNEDEREGYVPNVVYSCGAMIHNDLLVIPYAMSDSASSFATISVDEILKNMTI